MMARIRLHFGVQTLDLWAIGQLSIGTHEWHCWASVILPPLLTALNCGGHLFELVGAAAPREVPLSASRFRAKPTLWARRG